MMKTRDHNRYALIYLILATVLLISSQVWGSDQTEDYYRIYGDDPYLKLDDTTSSEADWYLRVDKNLNEGFEIHNYDLSYAFYPFRIENRCPTNLLYLDNNGRIGINTSVPWYTVDAVGTRIRLRDSTASTAKKIQMRVDGLAVDLEAENVDLYLRSSGHNIIMNPYGSDYHVGIGTTNPNKKLHVRGADSATLDSNITAFRIENNTTTTGSRHMLQVVNNGNPILWFHNTDNDARWSMNPIGSGFVWNRGGTGAVEMRLEGDGDLIIRGSLTQNSDRNLKENIKAVDPTDMLAKVTALPISRWNFKHDTDKNHHVGPMAQDFYAAFSLGRDERGIAPADMSGVALAAIKGLHALVEEKEARIAKLEKQVKTQKEQMKTQKEQLTLQKEQLKRQQEQITKLSALESVVATLVEQMHTHGLTRASFSPVSPERNPL